jgi:ACR3 family arsenite efflux pump ArsB
MFTDRDLEPFHYFYGEETLKKRGLDLYKHIKKGTDRFLKYISIPFIILFYFGIIGSYNVNGEVIVDHGWGNVLLAIAVLFIFRYVLPFIIYMSLASYLSGYPNKK